MSSSGPGTARYLAFPDELVEIDEKLSLVDDRFSKNYRNPQGTPVTLSEKASKDFEEYLLAYRQFKEAEKKYLLIKKQFSETDGGKEMKKILHPDEESLPIESVINKDDIAMLSSIIEKEFGSKTTVHKTEVIGYDGAHIILTSDKDIKESDLKKLDFKNYRFDMNGISFKYVDKIPVITKIGFTSNVYHQYPPFRYEDYKELTEINKQRLQQYEKEQYEKVQC
jgi:hypothetical protein